MSHQHHEHACNCSCHEHHHDHSCNCSCHDHEHHDHHHDHSCNCSCHDHEHHDHHHDHHCDDPHCSCHDTENMSERDKEAQKLLDQATTLTIVEEYSADCDVNNIETFVKEGLSTLAKCFSVNGSIMGHVKALLSTSTGNMLISMTKVDDFNVITKGTWPPEQKEPIQLTVNAHSVLNQGTLTKQEMESLFKQK